MQTLMRTLGGGSATISLWNTFHKWSYFPIPGTIKKLAGTIYGAAAPANVAVYVQRGGSDVAGPFYLGPAGALSGPYDVGVTFEAVTNSNVDGNAKIGLRIVGSAGDYDINLEIFIAYDTPYEDAHCHCLGGDGTVDGEARDLYRVAQGVRYAWGANDGGTSGVNQGVFDVGPTEALYEDGTEVPIPPYAEGRGGAVPAPADLTAFGLTLVSDEGSFDGNYTFNFRAAKANILTTSVVGSALRVYASSGTPTLSVGDLMAFQAAAGTGTRIRGHILIGFTPHVVPDGGAGYGGGGYGGGPYGGTP